MKSVKVKKKMTKKNDSQNNTDVADTTEDTNTGGKQDTGSGTKDAQNEKGEWDGTAELEKMEYEVGEEIKVRYSKQPECAGEIKEYYTYGNRGEFIDYTEKYTKRMRMEVWCVQVSDIPDCVLYFQRQNIIKRQGSLWEKSEYTIMKIQSEDLICLVIL